MNQIFFFCSHESLSKHKYMTKKILKYDHLLETITLTMWLCSWTAMAYSYIKTVLGWKTFHSISFTYDIDSNVQGSSTISLSCSPVESSLFMGLITSASCGRNIASCSVSESLLSNPRNSDTKTENLSLVFASSKENISHKHCQCAQN